MYGPWIAQIGQGRGGFYTYEALENLVGLQIYNTDVVLPEFQGHQAWRHHWFWSK